MKKIILATLAAAALVACAQEDVVVAPKGEAIAFDNAFVDNTTKAIDPSITTKTLDQFLVYGTTQGDHDVNAPIVRIFDGVEVTGAVTATDGEGNVTARSWSYADSYTQYWIDGNKYNFAAIKNGTVASYENELPETIKYTADGKTDLLYAEAKNNIEGKNTGNGPVAFTFDHLLSKAVFTFTNTTPDDVDTKYYYKVESITISGLSSKANYTVSNKTWTETEAGHVASFGNIVADGTIADSADAVPVNEEETLSSNYQRLLIPGTRNVTISCTITLYYGSDDKVVDVINYSKAMDLTLVKGTAYSFNLQAGLNDPIKFTVSKVEGWNDPATVVPNVPQPDHDNILPDTNN